MQFLGIIAAAAFTGLTTIAIGVRVGPIIGWNRAAKYIELIRCVVAALFSKRAMEVRFRNYVRFESRLK